MSDIEEEILEVQCKRARLQQSDARNAASGTKDDEDWEKCPGDKRKKKKKEKKISLQILPTSIPIKLASLQQLLLWALDLTPKNTCNLGLVLENRTALKKLVTIIVEVSCEILIG